MPCWKCENFRTTVGVLILLCSFSSFMLYVNFSIVLVQLTTPPTHTIVNDPTCTDISLNVQNETEHIIASSDTYSTMQIATMLSTFCFGYFTGYLFSHYMASNTDAAVLTGTCFLFSGVITTLTHVCHLWSLYALLANRVLLGISLGLSLGGVNHLIKNWVPIGERKLFAVSVYGRKAAQIMSFLLCATIAHFFSWEAVMYSTGIFAVLLSFIWFGLVTESPDSNKFVSPEEKEYIELSERPLGEPAATQFSWKNAVRSPAVIVLMIAALAHSWNFNFFMMYLPLYFVHFLDYSLLETGAILSAAMFARILFEVLCIKFCQYLMSHYQFTHITFIRKLCTLISHVLTGTLLSTHVLCECLLEAYTTVVLLVVILNGAAIAGSLSNPTDIVGSYGFRLTFINHSIGNFAGIVIPIIVELIFYLNKESNLTAWFAIFTVNCVIYLAGGLLFLIFGSGNLRSWMVPRDVPDL